nr:hypothetical protein [Salmonella enterica]
MLELNSYGEKRQPANLRKNITTVFFYGGVVLAHVDKLSEDAFDDQCTGANPRYPLVSELRQLLLASFYGEAFAEQ